MNGTIATLRDLVPIRPLNRAEAMRIAELQATRLLALSAVTEPPVPESVIASLPRIQIERISPSPVSGAAHWSRGRWLIVVSGADPVGRQRFSLAHEFKHVLDNPFPLLYPATKYASAPDRVEQTCDFFAGVLLVPRSWLKRYYCDLGLQDLGRLARKFQVSQMAMQVRLLQVGLIEPQPRCQPQPIRKGGSSYVANRVPTH